LSVSVEALLRDFFQALRARGRVRFLVPRSCSRSRSESARLPRFFRASRVDPLEALRYE